MRANILIITLCLISGMAWGGMAFDGTNDFVQLPSSALLDDTNSISISAWFKLRSLDGVLIYRNNGFPTFDLVQISSAAANTQLTWIAQDGVSATTFTVLSTVSGGIKTNTAYHVVGTFNNSSDTASIYIDGVLSGTQTNASGGIKYDSDKTAWRIGSRDALAPSLNPVAGEIYNVQIFSTALTASEVLALYNSYGNTTNRPIASYWGASGYGDGQLLPNGTVIGDFSGNGLSGTASNGVRQVSATVPIVWRKFGTSSDGNIQHLWIPCDNQTSTDVVGGKGTTAAGTTALTTNGWEMGTSDANYIQLGGGISNSTNYTIAMWIYPDKTAMDLNAVGGWFAADKHTSNFDWQLNYDKTAQKINGVVWNAAQASTSTTFAATMIHATWQHIAFVVNADGSHLKGYYNGTLSSSNTMSIIPNNSSTNAGFGTQTYSVGANTKYHGNIANVIFYNSALNDEQVLELYNAQKYVTKPIPLQKPRRRK